MGLIINEYKIFSTDYVITYLAPANKLPPANKYPKFIIINFGYLLAGGSFNNQYYSVNQYVTCLNSFKIP